MRYVVWFLALLALCASCTKEEPKPAPAPVQATAPDTVKPKVVAFGDSLTAGLGLTANETYPAQLQKILDQAGYAYEVVNAGVSGDTTTDGLRRVDWVLDEQVKIVILELGANDILRGISPDLIQQNLSKMIESMQSRGATIVLAGMEAPTNSGPEYRKDIHALYRALADKYRLTFIPFFLQGVAGSESLNQEDLSHPNAKGAHILAQNIFETIQPLLKQ